MLSDAERKKAADILMAAQRDRKQATQLHITFPDITIEDSYAISTEVAQRKVKAGARLIGHKVGLTSKAMQRSSMIDEPDYGYILDDQLIADGAKVRHSDYCKPRVEVELAFIMGKRLAGPGVGLTDVLRATEYVIPAIEIVDARLQDQRKIVDTVADNGAAAASRWAGGRLDRWMSICAGWGASCTAIRRLRRPVWPPECWVTRRSAWPGSPTRLVHSGTCLSPGILF
jgi:2-oxo-hept-3-ene-1,7-dioate hydratase